jgi:hypothetical protein
MRMTPEQYEAFLQRQRAPQKTFAQKVTQQLAPIAREAQERKPRVQHEEQKQIDLMNWAKNVTVGNVLLFEWLYHVPNGGYRNEGEAGRFKAMGVKAGYPDICLDVPSGDYHGARWELKHGDGRLSDSQKDRHVLLRSCGFYVNTYWQWQHIAQDIIRYLSGQQMFLVVVREPVPQI